MRASCPTRSSIFSSIRNHRNQRIVNPVEAFHAHNIKSGFPPEMVFLNVLLNVYSKSSDLASAKKLFDEMQERNIVTFSTLISCCAQSSTPQFAFSLIPQLQKASLSPNQFVYSSLILACSKLKWVDQGKQIHAQVIVSDFELDVFVRTSLIDMYSKFGDLESAVSVFGLSLVRDSVMYNAMISGFVSFSYFENALELFVEARRSFFLRPSEFTFSSVVKACTNFEREVGEQIHGFSVKMGFDFDCFVATSVVDMYGRFGDMVSSEKVFRNVLSVDLALYNAIIVGFSLNGLYEFVLQFYGELKFKGFVPNESTFASVLRACSSLRCASLGRVFHGIVEKTEFRGGLVVNTALIDMYMKCGRVRESCRVFNNMSKKSTVLYNSMIGGYGQNGNSDEALRLFIDMNRHHLEPDLATFVVLMNLCVGHEGAAYVHAIKRGFGLDPMVQNSLLDGLIKSGSIGKAQELFNKMPHRSVVSWTTMISGLSQLCYDADALNLFKRMQLAGVNPNNFTISCLFKACGNLASLEHGRCMHGYSIKHGTHNDKFTNSSLLDMYANCGALDESYRLFEVLPKTDTVTWNSMITGFAQHGRGTDALKLLERMENYGVKPNHVTFISLLLACSHSGLVDQGVHIFESMAYKYSVMPCIEHYACMVDMYGRVGMLDRVKLLIDEMPFEADVSIWKIVLAACKLHGDVKLANIALDHVMRVENEDKKSFVTMSNILSDLEKRDEAEKMWRTMREQGVRKDPGVSWVHIKSIC